MSAFALGPVLAKLAAMFVIVALGWWMRRRRLLGDGATSTLSRLTIDLSFPCLTFDQMLRTLDRQALAQSAPLLVLGVLLLLVSIGTGWFWGRRVQGDAVERRTLAFVIGLPNWIFLPLPLAEAMAGSVGVRTILLLNVPAQIFLWTLSLGILRGSLRGAHGGRALLTNPGLLATAAAILLVVLHPASTAWPGQASAPGALLQAAGLLGALCIPLSLLITGAQLADLAPGNRSLRLLSHALAGRLVVAPLAAIVAVELVGRALGVEPLLRMLCHVVTVMPVAVSCGVFAERYGGDRDLAAQAILFSTAASLLTVPLFFLLLRWLV